jgi:iron complex transport system substrate-binding protein
LSAKRIVSLVPSITELLVDLGLEENIVGVTKFCVHPEHLRKNTTIVGGTKNLRMDVIRQLQPDLILANKEENVKEQVEALADRVSGVHQRYRQFCRKRFRYDQNVLASLTEPITRGCSA